MNLLSDRLFSQLQYGIPKLALTLFFGRLAAIKGGMLTTETIRWYIGRYKVDMTEAADPDPSSFKTFQDFFTRPLKPGARPLAEADFICPVDGSISQFGPIEQEQLFQAKGHHYALMELLGGDRELAAQYENGSFATLYLSPGDYHRIHMPCDGRPVRMIYVPGDLFSVNPATASHIPKLFARNERLICVFDAGFGPFVMILVGAAIVGSMATVWHGVVNSPRPGMVQEWRYQQHETAIQKQGEEMGRFRLGSTVIMLFPRDTCTFSPTWSCGRPVRMGTAAGSAPKTRRAGSKKLNEITKA